MHAHGHMFLVQMQTYTIDVFARRVPAMPRLTVLIIGRSIKVANLQQEIVYSGNGDIHMQAC